MVLLLLKYMAMIGLATFSTILAPLGALSTVWLLKMFPQKRLFTLPRVPAIVPPPLAVQVMFSKSLGAE